MIFCIELLALITAAGTATRCHEGEYLNQTICVKCGPGQFQVSEDHEKTSCEECAPGLIKFYNLISFILIIGH